jgi:hypothetical protein
MSSKQIESLRFLCATALKGKRFVTVTGSTLTAAYTAGAAAPNGYTVKDSDNGVVEVYPLGAGGSFMIELAGTVTVGAQIEVGADGKGVVLAAGVPVAFAYTGGVSGGFIETFLLNNIINIINNT